MFCKHDLEAAGSVKFLSCKACKYGCALEQIHQNVTVADVARGFFLEATERDHAGYVLKRRTQGGCVLLDDRCGCGVDASHRPVACLVCPLQIDREGYVVANVFCPDAQAIALGIIRKDKEVCSYVAAAVRMMLVDREFCQRSAQFVANYTCRLVLGHASTLVELDKFDGEDA